ncbi:P-loop containing nucleoside triphosphate hydrolase protein [Suillus subalutaceus]|uniref:P-loop containing nucleoside triphosphate hydrolase protein n=1 Tax=Suillus subalutaceus TaxID=48586 RepID=UPI001B86B5FE|nr:P-loop containing nucleoside triphosphate hydrolase protein [Suillus subalutaceus]KAG1874643.1 P-loop containing nucleoside triphosphate hydrolase protein [Suillus subalutaceus]
MSISHSDMAERKPDVIWTVHVEVRLSTKSRRRVDVIQSLVRDFITNNYDPIQLPSVLNGWEADPTLASSVDRIAVSESACPSITLRLKEVSLEIHAYQPHETDAVEEYANGTPGRDGEENVLAASVCELPCKAWEGLWDGLIYPDNIKLKLLDYIHATFVLSDAGVDFNLVTWNRVVLLHGPPGTGKTSLCRALAQKLSIRLSHRYSQSRLLEINSHSLFSRWFSESGKLVQRLFSNIMEMVEDEDCFVVVLIDEVESLTAARAGAMAGTEPSDGLRVVNALLTQLDKLRYQKNVLVMSTSNLAKAIDSAFVDRADIIQYVDLPPREAIYEILRILQETTVPALDLALYIEGSSKNRSSASDTMLPDLPKELASTLLALADKCRAQQLSGRALRRLPVLALARYIGIGVSASSTTGNLNNSQFQTDIHLWLDAMGKVLDDRAADHGKLL